MTLNLHVAGSWPDQKYVAALGLAIVLLHSLGGTVAQGFNQGYVTFAGRAYGLKNRRIMQEYNHKQMCCLALCFLVLAALMLLAEDILLLLRQDPEVARISGQYGIWLLPAFFLYYVFDFLRSYLNSMDVFTPILLILLASGGLHLGLSLYFKEWVFYCPIGCTTLTYLFAVALEIFYILLWTPMPGGLTLPVLSSLKGFGEFLKEQTYMMMPQFLDVFSFEINSLIIGSFAIAEMTAAHVAVSNLIATLYSLSFGVGGAVCAMTANLIGENKPNRVRALYCYCLGWSALLAVVFFSLLSIPATEALVLNFYSSSPDTTHYMAQALLIYKWFFLLDYIQGSTSSFLKSFGYGQSLMWSYIVVYYLIGVTLSFTFAVWLDLQIQGVWLAFGCSIATISLYIQFKLYRTDWGAIVQQRFEEINTQPE